MFTALSVKLLLALLFGAAIGLERESSQKEDQNYAGGIRTYALISLLGALAAIFYANGLAIISFLVTGSFLAFIIAYYAVGSYTSRDFGMTSELAMFFTFILGLLSVLEIMPLQLVVTLFVILVLILSLKRRTKQLMIGISSKEIDSFVSYAIIALVVLPFLPNFGYKLADIPILPGLLENGFGVNLGQFANLELINPQRIWLIVALITGIDLFGYVLGRLLGNKKSFILTSCVGGFISSTSTTQSLAQKSKGATLAGYLVSAAILANLASFLQVFLLVGPLNAEWLAFLMPSLLIMIALAAFLAFFFFRRHNSEKSEQVLSEERDKIFSLVPALKFAALLIAVKLVTKICLIIFGQSGFVVSSIIASFAGIDAIVVNLAEMAGGAITFKFALITFLLVNTANLLSKAFYSFLQGSRKFALNFFLSMVLIAFFGFIGMFLTR